MLIIVVQGLFHVFLLLPLALSTFGADHPHDHLGADHHDDLAGAAHKPVAGKEEGQDDEESTSSVHTPVDDPTVERGPRMFEEEEAGSDQQQSSQKSSKRTVWCGRTYYG